MIRVRTTEREDGTVLILALIFISVIGVIATALLSFEQTAMRQVRSVRNVNTRETGTNAGIDWAVQSIKSHAAVCFEGGAGYETLTINAREVKVYCRTTNGSSAGPGGWALYLNGGILTTKSGGGGPKQ